MTNSNRSERESVRDTSLETLLTEQDYARIIKRSVASIRRDRAIGSGCPYLKLGALVRYRPEDIKAYLERSLRSGQVPGDSAMGAR